MDFSLISPSEWDAGVAWVVFKVDILLRQIYDNDVKYQPERIIEGRCCFMYNRGIAEIVTKGEVCAE
jgi:hypothetical protein